MPGLVVPSCNPRAGEVKIGRWLRLAYLGSSRPVRGPIWGKKKKMMPCITPYDLWGSTCTHAHMHIHMQKQPRGLGVMEQKAEVGCLLPWY